MARPASVALKSQRDPRALVVCRNGDRLQLPSRVWCQTPKAPTQALQALQYNLPTGTHPGVRNHRAEAHSAKGAFHVRCNRNVKALRVVAMAARQDAKRLDLVSYALVFLLFAVAAEAIVAALIW